MTEINEDYKIIDYRIYDPQNALFGNKKDKSELRIVKCNNSDKCDAFKKGKCVMFSMFREKCPYGKRTLEEGFTIRARKYGRWMREKRELVKDVKQLKNQEKICSIGDYIYFPYPHWTLDKSVDCEKRSSLFSSGQNFIHKNSFTIDLFEQIINAKPKALMGGVIKSFQEETVPKIVAHCEEEIPEFYNSWVNKHPESADRFAIKDYVGRKALMVTLKKNISIDFGERKGLAYWDGEYLTFKKYEISFFPVKSDETLIKVKPKKDATVKVTNNNHVYSETVFID